MAKRDSFEVIVGNIGSVHMSTSFKKANQHYEEYVEQSKSGVGRAGGEQVTMMKNGEPHLEYDPRFNAPKTWRELRSWIDQMRPVLLDKSALFIVDPEDDGPREFSIKALPVEVPLPKPILTATDNF